MCVHSVEQSRGKMSNERTLRVFGFSNSLLLFNHFSELVSEARRRRLKYIIKANCERRLMISLAQSLHTTGCWLALDESCAVASIGASRAWCTGKERSKERDLWNNARLRWSETGGGVQAAHCVMRSRKPLCAAKASKEPCVRIPAGRRRAWQRRRLCIGRRHSSCP